MKLIERIEETFIVVIEDVIYSKVHELRIWLGLSVLGFQEMFQKEMCTLGC